MWARVLIAEGVDVSGRPPDERSRDESTWRCMRAMHASGHVTVHAGSSRPGFRWLHPRVPHSRVRRHTHSYEDSFAYRAYVPRLEGLQQVT